MQLTGLVTCVACNACCTVSCSASSRRRSEFDTDTSSSSSSPQFVTQCCECCAVVPRAGEMMRPHHTMCSAAYTIMS